jgi:hypothetical protein
LIELLSLNNCDKNFFIVFGNLLTNKYNKKREIPSYLPIFPVEKT